MSIPGHSGSLPGKPGSGCWEWVCMESSCAHRDGALVNVHGTWSLEARLLQTIRERTRREEEECADVVVFYWTGCQILCLPPDPTCKPATCDGGWRSKSSQPVRILLSRAEAPRHSETVLSQSYGGGAKRRWSEVWMLRRQWRTLCKQFYFF